MRVFLSYAPEHAHLAERLTSELSARNVESVSTPPGLGDNWLEELTQIVAGADACVFFVGSEAGGNRWLKREWSGALRADWDGAKPMIPLVVGEAVLPSFLRDRIALRIDPDTPDFSGVAESVIEAMQRPHANRDPSAMEKAREEYLHIAQRLRNFAATLEN